jgi:hypothetical protein
MQTEIKVKTAQDAIRAALKPLKKRDKIRCSYIHENGDLQVWWTRSIREGGLNAEVEYWKIARHAVKTRAYSGAMCCKGRVVLHSAGIARILPHVASVSWGVGKGSDNSRKAGFDTVEYLSLCVGDEFSDTLDFHSVPNFMSGGICVQLDFRESTGATPGCDLFLYEVATEVKVAA